MQGKVNGNLAVPEGNHYATHLVLTGAPHVCKNKDATCLNTPDKDSPSDFVPSIKPSIALASPVATVLLIDSKRAFSLGLVNGIFPNETLLKDVLAFTNKILKNGPIAVKNSLFCIQKAEHVPHEEGMETEAKLFAQSFETKETKEGISAFIEKRTPDFD